MGIVKYRGLIFDIDNTLVPHGAPADARAEELFLRLKAIGFKCCLISNNKEPRVKMFFDGVCADYYIYRANKPGTGNYEKAMKLMGCDKSNTLFVGDQIFTDTLGGNRAGVTTILVRSINNHNFWLKARHVLEKPFIYLARKRRIDYEKP
jgi:HAD superfamily phosphatase (TIGR01668 family)